MILHKGQTSVKCLGHQIVKLTKNFLKQDGYQQKIENGINQEIIEKLVDTLVARPQQILVTTHSPLILNFLDDDLARESVQFIYKSPQGESHIRRFFEIPRIGEKLSYMGPGDAFVDTNLEALTEECIELDRLEKNPRSEVIE